MKNLKIKLSGLIILSVLFFYAKAQNCWDPLDSTYTMGFEDIELAEFNLWTLNDDNYDEQNWDRLEWIEFPHSGSYSLITRLYGDWAISRCFYLEQGKEYEISFWHFTFNWDPDQNLILAVGDSAKGSRMSDTLLNLEGLGNTSRKQLKAIAKFKPIITGTYYFGWKADGYSSWGTTRISIDDIEIKEFACTATVDLGTDDTICEGSSKQLDAGADFTTYLWKKDGVQVGTERYLTVDTSGTYKVEVKDQFNCETNDEINISLFTYPEVLNVIAGGDTVICDKDSVMLSTNLLQDDIDNSTIKWYEEDSYSSVGTGATYKAKTPGYYYYKLEHNSLGCKATSNSKTVLVNYPYNEQAIDRVTVDHAAGHNRIEWIEPIAENNISFYYIYKETDVSDKYEKIGSVAAPDTFFVDESSEPEVRASKYKLSISDSCSNESDLSLAHKTIHLSIYGQNKSSNLTWDKYEGRTYTTYRIERSVNANMSDSQLLAELPSSLNSYTDTKPVAGFNNYYVIGIVDKGKKDEVISYSNMVINSETGLNEFAAAKKVFQISPNPASERLNVEFLMLNAGKVDIRLLDITGREVAVVLNEERAVGRNEVAFNLGNIDKGIYFVKAAIGENLMIKKIIKN